MSSYYTTEEEACSLLDLGIWSNCAKFVVNFNIDLVQFQLASEVAVAEVQKELIQGKC